MIRTRAPRPDRAEPRGPTVAPELDALADRVGRLRPSHRDPEAFHVEKDEIERALRRLARRG
nr:hypothetical protein [Methylobacterium sp. L1A1]